MEYKHDEGKVNLDLEGIMIKGSVHKRNDGYYEILSLSIVRKYYYDLYLETIKFIVSKYILWNLLNLMTKSTRIG